MKPIAHAALSVLALLLIAPAAAADPLAGARLTVVAEGQSREYQLVPTQAPPDQASADEPGKIAVFPPGPLRPAPAAVHVHALDIPLEPHPLEAVYEWDFGDPQGRFNTLGGFLAGHVYDRPGEYTINLRITEPTGRQHVHQTTVLVAPDTRTTIYLSADGDDSNTGLHPASPWRTLGRAQRAMNDGVSLRLRRGDRFPVDAEFVISASNIRIGAYGEGEPPLLLSRRRGTMIVLRDAARNIIIEDLAFDSPVENAPGHGRVGHSALRVAGANVLVRNCTFLRLDDAINSAARPRGLLVMDNLAPRNDCLRAYFAWAEGSDHVYLGNRVVNSTDEHVIRAGGSGVQRILIAHNDFDRVAPTKTTIRLSTVRHAWLEGNVLATGPVEIGGVPDPNIEKDQRAEHVVIRGNRLEQAVLELRHGAHDVLVVENRLARDNGTAIFVQAGDRRWPQRGVSGLRIVRNLGVNQQAQGTFIEVQGRAEGAITLAGNRYLAPRLVPGGRGEPAVVRVFDEDLGSFARIAENVWPDVPPAPRAAGIFFVAPAHGREGYRSLQWWVEQPAVSNEQVVSISEE